MGKEKTVILGLRCDPEWKELARKEAESQGQTLTDFVWSLIDAGFEKIYMQDVTHGRQNETLPNDDKGDAV